MERTYVVLRSTDTYDKFIASFIFEKDARECARQQFKQSTDCGYGREFKVIQVETYHASSNIVMKPLWRTNEQGVMVKIFVVSNPLN